MLTLLCIKFIHYIFWMYTLVFGVYYDSLQSLVFFIYFFETNLNWFVLEEIHVSQVIMVSLSGRGLEEHLHLILHVGFKGTSDARSQSLAGFTHRPPGAGGVGPGTLC